ncbi:Uncharacterized protein DAT39_014372 [Clarias magur]|uniref:Uncharacterized protein n=1 Tax=Clarias magur TaxID=1594786 RepID=A0A8J4TWZ8_CLAMG|nr:Uncharacterized protein DAT39_014372 [Clarias magur]
MKNGCLETRLERVPLAVTRDPERYLTARWTLPEKRANRRWTRSRRRERGRRLFPERVESSRLH